MLRIYQPTNSALAVEVNTAAPLRFPAAYGALTVTGNTALETPLAPDIERRLALRGEAERFHFAARTALTTIAISQPDPNH